MPRRPLIRPLRWVLAAAIAAAALPAATQPARGAGGVAATRGVSQYYASERALEQALVQRDRDALDSLLDPDFQARLLPRDPVARDAWMAGVARKQPARIHDLSVHEFEDGAVASFLLDVPLANARVRAVVDVWKNGKLRSRTESAAAGAQPAQGANVRE